MTRIERMDESLKSYENKIVEIRQKIEDEKKKLIEKRAEAEAKLAEAKKKFDDLYGNLPELPVEEGVDTTNGLFNDNNEGEV